MGFLSLRLIFTGKNSGLSRDRDSCYKERYFREAVIVRVRILASSSSGNSTFIGTERTRILVDAGLSRKATFTRLQQTGIDPQNLDAILITHEHSDHVAGLNVIVRGIKDRGIPVYLSRLTAPTIPWERCEPDIRHFQAGASFTIGDIDVASFTIPHDAVDPVGFCFYARGVKIGLVTDLGYIPDSVKHHLQDTDCLILESNHDIEMLKVGPYPWQVKQRVMSRKGHLSNESASEFIGAELASATRTLVLGHLSEHNNHPEIVRVTAQQALDRRGLDTELIVATPRRLMEPLDF